MDGRPSCHWPLAEPTRSPKNSPREENGSAGGSPNSPPRERDALHRVVGIMDKIIHSADDIDENAPRAVDEIAPRAVDEIAPRAAMGAVPPPVPVIVPVV